MSLYQTVKSAITVRQVGEMYGMEPDRHGMVCCPFHSDSDPSMKLNDTYYYCFGSGLSKKVTNILETIQKKATLTKEALIHARDLDYIGKRTFLGNYSLTEEEFSKLKKQADHGYMMDVENRRLKEELSTAKKEAAHWGQKYHELWYEVKPYLDALHRAPELVRSFLEKILAPKQERTMNVPQKNRKRGQDMEL